MSALRLRYLSFFGPNRAPATVEFRDGLNVIYGASNTGKSFIVEAVDFMLGGRGPLRDIPERVGYSQVMLAIETENSAFSLLRSTEGGPFRVFDGIHSDKLPDGEGRILSDQHNERREDNLSVQLLKCLSLTDRHIRRNRRGDTQSLSFRNLARLVVVNEEEIIQQRSPLSDGNYVADTANASTFKLLLTGVDDGSLKQADTSSPAQQTRGAQLDLLDDLIGDYRERIKKLAGPPRELEEQLERLEGTLLSQSQDLVATEAQFRDASAKRRHLFKRLEDDNNRLTEVLALLERFALLAQHYVSDLKRLEAIEESGSLFAALGPGPCPLCGAAPEHHGSHDDCGGNVLPIVEAARSEMTKIRTRQGDLGITIEGLEKERNTLQRRIPRTEQSISEASIRYADVVAPLKSARQKYSDLSDKRVNVQKALSAYSTLQDLEERKSSLERESATDGSNTYETGLSASVVDKFSVVVLELLKLWHFPSADRLHFDMKTKDFVINGKPRASYGKGLRAITQAAFSIGLLEYCKREDTPHPGFVVLDSPLLSYREPDNPEDDLRGHDLDSSFYNALGQQQGWRQTIIIENTDPPASAERAGHYIVFTGVNNRGRFGLFPPR
ncbi:AAA family ATPase [Devosia sp. XGJD_8]|uniref:AAA family ATPase n=1 Tax=Devosia sp. XGJD_8 TaxID=3391187 RepID=UPI003984863E